jgi:hypothetical protein
MYVYVLLFIIFGLTAFFSIVFFSTGVNKAATASSNNYHALSAKECSSLFSEDTIYCGYWDQPTQTCWKVKKQEDGTCKKPIIYTTPIITLLFFGGFFLFIAIACLAIGIVFSEHPQLQQIKIPENKKIS